MGWNIDNSHSSIGFTVRHMMFAKVHGRFDKWTATFDMNDADISKSTVSVEIDAASINTNDEKRDGHLKSGDFFDVATHPKLTFKSKRVEKKGDELHVVGDLSIHGVTKEVTLEVEQTGSGKDPWGNARVAFNAKTSINRKDYGLNWNQALEAGGVLVSEKVDISIEVQAVKS
jgi:polyisoprenoid-binding protein YceI